MDLGASKAVAAVTSWSFNQDGRRARQILTIYGSNAESDPGWNLDDPSRFKPLASIDANPPDSSGFLATSLRAQPGKSLGSFRWIVWKVEPLNSTVENTAFQELAVETR
jgi:hypothetical protein